jgi:hypothetical protein
VVKFRLLQQLRTDMNRVTALAEVQVQGSVHKY